MFDYLQPRDGPVVDGLEDRETVYAANQPEYTPLRTLKSPGPEGAVMSRWSPTPEQREAIAKGADIFLELFEFHQPLRPIRMAIGDGCMCCMGSDFFVAYAVQPPPFFAGSSDRAASETEDARFLKDLGIAPDSGS